MLDWFAEMFNKLGNALLSLFPLSPFRDVINDLEHFSFLGYLNWFIPIGTFLKIGTGWLAAIGLYYAYSMVARWLKLIQ